MSPNSIMARSRPMRFGVVWVEGGGGSKGRLRSYGNGKRSSLRLRKLEQQRVSQRQGWTGK
jgi:hypothetical protein